jgi:hypothetical protein
METVGAGAEYNLGTGKFTIYANISMYNYVGGGSSRRALASRRIG